MDVHEIAQLASYKIPKDTQSCHSEKKKCHQQISTKE